MSKIVTNREYAIAMANGQRTANPSSRAHLGACMTNGKQRVLAMNKMAKTHPLSAGWFDGGWITKGIHAEMQALILGRKFSDGATLYVARVLKDETLAMALPCPVCMQLIYTANVDKVHYTSGPNEWKIWNVGDHTRYIV